VRTLGEAARGAHGGAGGPDGGEDVARVLGEHLAGVRHAHRATRALEQRDAQLALQRGDVRTDPGLGAVHLLGGGGEPPAVHHREERPQPVQLHPGIVAPDGAAPPR
jgi:hypothetical protein